jgi:7SK snRNA methylphosphate capping enzyme
MPPKKQKLPTSEAKPSQPSSHVSSSPLSDPTNSPRSPASPQLKRARNEGARSSSSASDLPAAKACAPAKDDHKKNPEVKAVSSSGGAAAAAGKKKHFPFIYGNYSGYYGYRSPSVEDARLKVLVRSMFDGKRCLDIGCNAGELTVAIAQRYAPQHILGVDIDGSLVRLIPLCFAFFLSFTCPRVFFVFFVHPYFPFRRARAHLAHLAKEIGGASSSAEGAQQPSGAEQVVDPFVFPYNCGFRRENFVDTADADATYSVITCLSTTKWVHFNWGDDGIKRLFKRVYDSLCPGGMFILEAQVSSPAFHHHHQSRIKPPPPHPPHPPHSIVKISH